MRSVEDQVLGVALNLGQSLHQEGVDIEPLGLELSPADICTPLQGRHALDERDTVGVGTTTCWTAVMSLSPSMKRFSSSPSSLTCSVANAACIEGIEPEL
jgi:hypothetical protein